MKHKKSNNTKKKEKKSKERHSLPKEGQYRTRFMSFVTIYNVCHIINNSLIVGITGTTRQANSGFKNRDPSSVICLKMAKSIILSTNPLFKCSLKNKNTPLCEAVWLLLKTSTCVYAK